MNRVRCPICDREMTELQQEWPSWPFCCSRCRLIDLGRWLGEGYAISATPDEEKAPSTEDDDVPDIGRSFGRSL